MNSEAEGLKERLRQCAKIAGSGDELARRTGIPRRTLESYLSGKSEPKALTVGIIARSCYVSTDWLISGASPMRPDEALPITSTSAASAVAFDETLMGQITDGITAAYKDMGQAIAPIQLGRLAARLHNEIAAIAEGPEDFSGALKMRLAQLRQELRAAAADPTSSKRRA